MVWVVDTVLVALGRLGRVEAGLYQLELVLRHSHGHCTTLWGAYLDQVLALGLRHKGLELGRSKCVDQASFRDHQE